MSGVEMGAGQVVATASGARVVRTEDIDAFMTTTRSARTDSNRPIAAHNRVLDAEGLGDGSCKYVYPFAAMTDWSLASEHRESLLSECGECLAHVCAA
jgi:hypothetical protein